MTEFYLISKFVGFRSIGEVAELAEGARLLSEYRGIPPIVGSNPTLSAMFYAYILKSEKDGGYYFGSTSNLENRLKTHNAGKVRSTKGRRLWKLHYFEKYNYKQEAMKRERFFKTINGYNWLKNQKITER